MQTLVYLVMTESSDLCSDTAFTVSLLAQSRPFAASSAVAGMSGSAFQSSILALSLQEKLYAYVSVGGRHQNTSLNTSDARSPSWSDTLTFDHPTSEHSDISVAVYAKHTLLPDSLVGSAGVHCLEHSRADTDASLSSFSTCFLASADYPTSRISSDEQLRIPLLDKSGDTTGELSLTVNTGGYSKHCCSTTNVISQLSHLMSDLSANFMIPYADSGTGRSTGSGASPVSGQCCLHAVCLVSHCHPLSCVLIVVRAPNNICSKMVVEQICTC